MIGHCSPHHQLRVHTDRARLASNPYHQMPVTGAGIELDRLGPQLLIHDVNEFPRLFRFNGSGRRVFHHDVGAKLPHIQIAS